MSYLVYETGYENNLQGFVGKFSSLEKAAAVLPAIVMKEVPSTEDRWVATSQVLRHDENGLVLSLALMTGSANDITRVLADGTTEVFVPGRQGCSFPTWERPDDSYVEGFTAINTRDGGTRYAQVTEEGWVWR